MRISRLAPWGTHSGFSVTDLVIILTVIGVLTAIAVPQVINQRRLVRSAALTREIVGQIRLARLKAMSQRKAFTLQYDHANKQLLLIDHNASGITVLADPTYPTTAVSRVISAKPLTAGDLAASEIAYGIPAGLPTGALGDGVMRTPLTASKINITFQPDGSVIDVNGNPLDRALFIYNSRAAQSTATAISVVGSTGKVSLWRYDTSVDHYVE